MQTDESRKPDLTERTVLIAPAAPRELVAGLERHGARVMIWPEIEIGKPESFTALDETIENLFGYDWLLFCTGHAAEFFLMRLQDLGHEISELDTLRVCAIGEATVAKLEASQVHIDLIPNAHRSDAAFEAIENYVGGQTALGRLNFLILRSSTSPDRVRDLLEDAGARVDVVPVYRSVSNRARLAQLTALLTGGGIDWVAFDSSASVRDLAELLSPQELDTILTGVQVFCLNESTASVATDFGLRPLPGPELTTGETTGATAEHFHTG